MNRRDMLCGGAAAAIAMAPGILRAGAAHGCYRAEANKVRCQVGFPDAPYIEPQECRADCWANCLAYMLRGFGAKISVGSVLWRMEQEGACRNGDDEAQLMAASGKWIDDTGRTFWVSARRLQDIRHGTFSTEEFQPLVNALSARPLIAGSPGHSMVLTEMAYVDAPMVMMRQEELTFRDPWTGTSNLRRLAYEETPERMFAIDIRIRRM
ncbi:hypothetical protein [Mangrovicoccus sp. HB161399]|uniref:hypothetical protein n=1 Tax=Mangrovicoccus sp. HB161399 TaxID=2720392 RepID=UPI0015560ECF|nr:hypothetical protein [Mangrovicoccus sp. HB161399]